jgi:uncharacterized RDD family membrane protein YckC
MQQPPPLPALNPYAAPAARVEDISDDQLVLADRGIRLAAKLVDGLIVGGGIGVLGVIAAVAIPAFGKDNHALMILFGLVMVALCVALIVVNMVMLHRHGQTIAKRIFGIKIVRGDGSRCALSRIIFARWLPVTLLGAIPLVGWIASLTDALMIFGETQRCLHDVFADTLVVKV